MIDFKLCSDVKALQNEIFILLCLQTQIKIVIKQPLLPVPVEILYLWEGVNWIRCLLVQRDANVSYYLLNYVFSNLCNLRF